MKRAILTRSLSIQLVVGRLRLFAVRVSRRKSFQKRVNQNSPKMFSSCMKRFSGEKIPEPSCLCSGITLPSTLRLRVDGDVIADHLLKRSGTSRLYFAAWEGYLTSSLYTNLFGKLHDEYSRAIAIDPAAYTKRRYRGNLDEALATHLALTYLHLEGFGFDSDLYKSFGTLQIRSDTARSYLSLGDM